MESIQQKELNRSAQLLEGLYQILETGEITSLHTRNPGKLISKRVDRAGYYTVRLSQAGVTKTYLLHRLLAQCFIPNPENKPCVNHINGNKLDYRLCNLEWSTESENTRHAFLTRLCRAPEINSKQVIDSSTGRVFQSIWHAAYHTGIPYSTMKNYLSGRRKNRTALKTIHTTPRR